VIIAGGAANGILVTYNNIYNSGIVPILNGTKIYMIIPILFGLLAAAVFVTRISWLTRYPTMFMMGISMGLMVTGTIGSQIIGQISDTMTGLTPGTSLPNLINAILVLIGVVSSTLYFVYGRQQKGAFRTLTRLGRYFLLASLGPGWAGEMAYHMAFGIKYVQIIVEAFRTILPI
jgi:hypothetical protein